MGGTESDMHADVGGTRRCWSLQMVELLLDLIYGDLVHGDKGCRRVADAMIAAYEGVIQWLVTSEAAFTAPLKGAINTYCARYVLRTAPEILIASRDAAAAYKQIAVVLREMESMEKVGEAIADELSHLTRRLETKRFSRLLDLMADAVLAYMQKAAKQHEEEEKAQSTIVQTEPGFWTCVARFAAMPPPTNGNNKRRWDNDDDEGVVITGTSVTPACNYSAELSLAVKSPERSTAAPGVSIQGIMCARGRQQQQSLSPSPPSPTPVSTSTGRDLLQPADSLLSALGKLDGKDSQTAQDVNSCIVVDDSLGAPPAFSSSSRRDFIVPGFGNADTSLLGGDVQVRSYFLCDKAHRYVPVEARGFFT